MHSPQLYALYAAPSGYLEGKFFYFVAFCIVASRVVFDICLFLHLKHSIHIYGNFPVNSPSWYLFYFSSMLCWSNHTIIIDDCDNDPCEVHLVHNNSLIHCTSRLTLFIPSVSTHRVPTFCQALQVLVFENRAVKREPRRLSVSKWLVYACPLSQFVKGLGWKKLEGRLDGCSAG